MKRRLMTLWAYFKSRELAIPSSNNDLKYRYYNYELQFQISRLSQLVTKYYHALANDIEFVISPSLIAVGYYRTLAQNNKNAETNESSIQKFLKTTNIIRNERRMT